MTDPLPAAASTPDPRSLADELKRILEASGDPHLLDGHPWAAGLLVRQAVADDPALERQSQGGHLLAALVGLFREMQPAAPPRRGKRLDTAWSQFGLLAAMYFAPVACGTPRPTSLRDAWGRIDSAIALFVFGRPQAEVPPAVLAPYRLTAAEPEPAPASTLSDWHVRGLERLAGLLQRRERRLSQQFGQSSPILDGTDAPGAAAAGGMPASSQRRGPRLSPRLRAALAGLLVLALLGAGWKAWRLLSLARALRAELAQVQALAGDEPDMEALAGAGPLLSAARRDVAALRREAGPFLWMGRGLAWLPVYGPDLAAAAPLLDLAGGLTVAADEAYQAGWPILQAARSANPRLSLPELLDRLAQAAPRFE
ncbi:MAG: hypothetical protein HY784_17120, partial [Chloroflexi bacterium]|nr:hypothetical protein [Chloroflexota bacterium]